MATDHSIEIPIRGLEEVLKVSCLPGLNPSFAVSWDGPLGTQRRDSGSGGWEGVSREGSGRHSLLNVRGLWEMYFEI